VKRLPPTELSRRLVALREQHDPPLSQHEAARLIGLSLRQYGRLERGQANPSLTTARKIAAAYGVEPWLLTGGTEQPVAVEQSPTLADLARLEAKIELLLAHFGLDSAAAGTPAQAPDLAALFAEGRDHAAAPARRRHIARSAH
jgi:transcriptional regulator with XRE-family HTH domain